MRHTRALLAALCAAGLAACAEQQAAAPATAPPQAAVAAVTTERVAIVESVNMTERTVLVRGEAGAQSGALATIRASDSVRNLGQIRPGDRVVATVTDAIAVSLARPEARGATGAAAVATRAPAGSRPAASVTEAERVRVRIEGIDLGRNSATVTTPSGARREVRVQDPAMRRFLRTLRPGDEVDVVFVESFSLRVLPPG